MVIFKVIWLVAIRSQLFSVDNFINTILSLLSEYLKQDRESQAAPDPVSPTNASPEDVMVKVGTVKY